VPYDRLDEIPTAPFVRRVADSNEDHATVETPPPRFDLDPRLNTAPHGLVEPPLTTTLPISADSAYLLFTDIKAIPEWLSVIRSVRILEHTRDHRAARAAFLGRLEGASIGYTLDYRYWDDERMLAWSTTPTASTQVAGRASFQSLTPKTCLFTYQLEVELPSGALPKWADPHFEGHPTSAAISDFREYVARKRHLGVR